MPKILQLDRHVADLIAAGEVVERPASAVKELVENAVDAGATQVTVEIQNGGMTYIRVTDNGCGISPEDAPTAFLRHATSKLRTKEDLAAIGTLGFRGVAWAAIASVSKIDLMTKTAASEGISLRLEAGRVLDQSPAGCPNGTTIVVRDLFYNTPARMKFMKRDTVEASQVAGTLQRQALAHPDVAFRLIKDGETVLQTAGSGDLHGTVYQVYGRQLAVDMVEVKSNWEGMSLSGYVTKPTATRGNRNYQQFFVNGRPVKSKLLTAALEQAYDNQIMTGRFPSCVLCLDLPCGAVDVNVHPAKTEVKFVSERAAFDCVHYGVLSALNKTPARPEMALGKQPEENEKTFPSMGRGTAAAADEVKSAPEQKQFKAPAAAASSVPFGDSFPSRGSRSEPVKAKTTAFRTMSAQEYKVFAAALEEKPQRKVAPAVAKAMAPQAQKGFVSQVPLTGERSAPVVEVCQDIQIPKSTPKPVPVTPAPDPEPVQAALPLPKTEEYRVVGEVMDTYIIIQQGDSVYFMDKHAAHERILFEKLRQDENPVMAQVLLSPMAASLTREEAAVILDNACLLEQYGYQVEDFGDGAVLVRQIPAELDENQAETALQALANDLLDGQTKDPKALRDEMLHTIACKAAIKAGWHTDPRERDALVRQVMERDDIKYCPHGRPVMITLTKKELEKQFKRS